MLFRSPALLFALGFALATPGFAASKKSGARKPAYPGIIQMQPAEGAPAVESGKLLSSDIGGLDLRFIRSAHEAGMMQSYLGELARTKGQSEPVKKLGTALAAEQAAEVEQLGKLAARKGVPMPSDPAALRGKLKGDLETLEGLRFDKALLDQFLAVNRLAVSAYEAGVHSQDPDIRSFVGQMLPVAKARLQLASKMAGAPTQAAGVPQFRNTTPPVTR